MFFPLGTLELGEGGARVRLFKVVRSDATSTRPPNDNGGTGV